MDEDVVDRDVVDVDVAEDSRCVAGSEQKKTSGNVVSWLGDEELRLYIMFVPH